MGMEPLILVANPGSASRKYALYQGSVLRANVHFELDNQQIIYTIEADGTSASFATNLTSLSTTATHVVSLLRTKGGLRPDETISRIGLRIVAPGDFFTHDHVTDNTFVTQMQTALFRAPLHVAAALDELHALRDQFPDTPIIGISDSAFHRTKHEAAWHYGLPPADAERLGIKRFGYHGLSVASVVDTLTNQGYLTEKVIVAHIGSGVSVTALKGGLSVDNTMGYSPLEGVLMATRSGNLDPTAAGILRAELGLDEKGFETYLNKQCGLLGLGGSSDIRELLSREAAGDRSAQLALQVYVYQLQKAIGQMAAAIDGADTLVLTGTVGLRSAPIRERLTERLGYLGFYLDPVANKSVDDAPITNIAAPGYKPIYVVETDEQGVMAKQTAEALLDT